ncbi:MAG: hypothetical protein Q9205_001022 [Flavoplaca limonia]
MCLLNCSSIRISLYETIKTAQPATITLTETRDSSDGSSVSEKYSLRASIFDSDDNASYISGVAEFPSSTPAAASPSNAPPPFSSLNISPEHSASRIKLSVAEPDFYPPPPFASTHPAEAQQPVASQFEVPSDVEPADNKGGESSAKDAEDKEEPPPPYTEGSSPLGSFTYVMAAAGGPASIITQVPQAGPPPLGGHTFADVGPDENISLDLRGTKFILSRDELLTLPEFVLLSLFPNGLLPDGHMNSFHEGDTYPVDYDPTSLQYMLDFFRTVAQTIPSSSPSPTTDTPSTDTTMQGSARDMLQDRAGIIVLREDLDFYAIPPKAEIDQPEMIEVKRAAGRALLKQDGIFSGLRKSEEAGTTEQHLIEMLTAGGFYNDDRWGHRASEPNKAVICSLALARLRTDVKGTDLANNNAVGMAQKLLLFWRKPARRCWWEGVELDNVDGIDGKLKVWIRRVWTLEMIWDNESAAFWRAGLALFRVLLRRSRNVLPPEALSDFRKHVIGAFRKDAKTQDQAAIRAALTSGYEVVNNLTTRKLHVLRQLAESTRPDKAMQDQFARRRASVGSKAKEQVSNRPKPRIFDTGRRSPRPAARPVLDGLPSPLPGHHRRVPTIINANHIPFLRFKKPQSPFLSHMIRKKTDEREKRVVRIQRLEKLLPLAEDEDRWDDTVRKINGISSNDGGITWAWATREALTHVKKTHKDNTIKRMHTAQRMFDIVEEQRKPTKHGEG